MDSGEGGVLSRRVSGEKVVGKRKKEFFDFFILLFFGRCICVTFLFLSKSWNLK